MTTASDQGTAAGRTLVLGLGNPILGDDAAGLLAARNVKRLATGRTDVEIQEASVAGFDVLDLLSGFQRVFLLDAIKTPGGRPGTIYRLDPDSLPTTHRIAAMHEINLSTALALGRAIGFDMPGEIVIFAIEVEDDSTFREGVSPAVQDAVEAVARCTVREALHLD